VKPRHPQTSGLGERWDGCIGEVLATTRFDAAERLEETLLRYVRLYNHQIPQKALRNLSPVQALKAWQEKRPELFMKQGI
jgi:transposase InsO family protein